MVAWAGGGTGPDFFIDAYEDRADWWGTQHTGTCPRRSCLRRGPLEVRLTATTAAVWGEIRDADSFAVIDRIWTLPTRSEEGMAFLEQEIAFDLDILNERMQNE